MDPDPCRGLENSAVSIDERAPLLQGGAFFVPVDNFGYSGTAEMPQGRKFGALSIFGTFGLSANITLLEPRMAVQSPSIRASFFARLSHMRPKPFQRP